MCIKNKNSYVLNKILGFPGNTSGKESALQCRRLRFDPYVRKIPGGGHGNLLQYSCLENPRERSLMGYSLWCHKELDVTCMHACMHAMKVHTL